MKGKPIGIRDVISAKEKFEKSLETTERLQDIANQIEAGYIQKVCPDFIGKRFSLPKEKALETTFAYFDEWRFGGGMPTGFHIADNRKTLLSIIADTITFRVDAIEFRRVKTGQTTKLLCVALCQPLTSQLQARFCVEIDLLKDNEAGSRTPKSVPVPRIPEPVSGQASLESSATRLVNGEVRIEDSRNERVQFVETVPAPDTFDAMFIQPTYQQVMQQGQVIINPYNN